MRLFMKNQSDNDGNLPVQQQISELRAFSKSLERENESLKKELDFIKEERSALNSSLQDRDRQISSANETLSRIRELVVTLSEHRKMIKSLNAQIENNEEINEFKNNHLDIESIEDSTFTAVQNIQSLETNISSIHSFISLIKEISDQTGLLSINASIEAARAGKDGKGFSIVASEVSKLSQRTHKAVLEMKALIENVNQSVAEAEESITKTASQVSSFSQNTEPNIVSPRIRQQLNNELSAITDKMCSIQNSLEHI